MEAHHNNQSLDHQAYYYVAMKFKDLYASLSSHKFFIWQMKAQNHSTVNEAFKYIHEILKWVAYVQEKILQYTIVQFPENNNCQEGGTVMSFSN